MLHAIYCVLKNDLTTTFTSFIYNQLLQTGHLLSGVAFVELEIHPMNV